MKKVKDINKIKIIKRSRLPKSARSPKKWKSSKRSRSPKNRKCHQLFNTYQSIGRKAMTLFLITKICRMDNRYFNKWWKIVCHTNALTNITIWKNYYCITNKLTHLIKYHKYAWYIFEEVAMSDGQDKNWG